MVFLNKNHNFIDSVVVGCYFCFFMGLLLNTKAIKVQGHRGSLGTHTENTIPAFLEAVDAKASAIELDLQVTNDGKVVIFHDFFVEPERLMHKKGNPLVEKKLLVQYSLTELKELRIPTLEELFCVLKGYPDIEINLEIKRHPEHPDWCPDPGVVSEKIVNIVKRFNFEDRVYYTSFDLATLQEVRKILPDALIGYILEKGAFEKLYRENKLIETARAVRAKILALEYQAIEKEALERLKREGFHIIAWSVNEPEDWINLIALGVEEIITDFPRKLVQFLSKAPL